MILHTLATLLLVSAMTSPQKIEPNVSPAELTHVSNSFHFDISAPLERVAPLFGPEAERGWAGKHWNPVFLYPQPGKDVQGAVFTVQHGPHNSIWINTIFNVPGGRMQYVSFIPEVLVTIVDVKLTPLDRSHTAVEVTYARTALQAAANDDVQALGDSDRDNGPYWKKDVETFLGLKSK
jgi:hypothetical protein